MLKLVRPLPSASLGFTHPLSLVVHRLPFAEIRMAFLFVQAAVGLANFLVMLIILFVGFVSMANMIFGSQLSYPPLSSYTNHNFFQIFSLFGALAEIPKISEDYISVDSNPEDYSCSLWCALAGNSLASKTVSYICTCIFWARLTTKGSKRRTAFGGPLSVNQQYCFAIFYVCIFQPKVFALRTH